MTLETIERCPEVPCPDCAVAPGTPHEEGCDVARCTVCGGQRLQCEMAEHDGEGTGTTWTGQWPGDAEVREGLATDLNDLYLRGVRGELRWDGQRWQRPIHEAKGGKV